AAGRIVYQLGADLRLFDLASGQDQALAIDLVSDFDQARKRWHKQPVKLLTDVGIGEDAERVAVVARGRLALAGVGPLRRVDLTLPGDARVFATALAPDGKAVVAITDQSGEQEIWRFPTDGSSTGTRLTRDGGAHRWDVFPSPDGRFLAHNDKRGRLFLLELASGANTLVDENPADFHADITWSPDSKALAFARSGTDRQLNQVFLLDVASRKVHVLTSDKYVSGAPAFSPDGHWLYFLSDRNFEAWPSGPWGDRNMGPGFARRTRVYALALQPGRRFPFQPKDELAPAARAVANDKDKSDKADKKDDKKKDPAPALPAIDYAGLAERLYEVPVAAGGYEALAVDGARLYLLDREPGDDSRPCLKTLTIADDGPKPETFMADVRFFQLSGNRKKLLIVKATAEGPGDLLVVDAGAKAPSELTKAQVRLKDWQLELDPRQEWRQMFADAWRMHREFLYDPALRGVDWDAVRARHEPLVARVAAREELNDVLAQMSAEVGSLHSQVVPGELRKATDGAAFASLGAELEAVDGGHRIARIFSTEAELPSERGPLAAPGVDAKVGDVITAINGVPTTERAPYAALLNQAGQQVLLTLKRGATEHRAVVVPVDGDRHYALAMTEWERSNLARVEGVSFGRIGYLHLRAMGGADVNTFAREFYAQFDRDGLILDVRNNRGGNIDSWIIEKLLRRAWAFWKTPGGPAYWNMQQTFRGHVVVLVNEHTYSDGETFAAGVKALSIGPLIGQRTAGAGVWLTGRNNLRDGGRARAAEFPQYDPEGHWLLEGRGVDPDVAVDNLPRATFDGRDAQLEAGLAWLRDKLAKEPVPPARARPIGPLGQPGADPRQ
ncbi:MAG: S41 family peptidase, partial [Vicinamibacteria bacterium]|nr:S41 family peptidase [Vicinamibacteria bacterium]